MSTAATAPNAPPSTDSQAQDPPADALDAAKTPVGPGAISAVGLVLALLLSLSGAVAIRDALVTAGVIHGSPWVEQAGRAVNGLRPAAWMVPVGAALVLLGLWLVVTALRPRPRSATSVTSTTGVFLRPKDVSRLAQSAAEQVDGVLAAKTRVTRRTLHVQVRSTGSPQVPEQVRSAVSERLTPLDSPPIVKVSREGAQR